MEGLLVPELYDAHSLPVFIVNGFFVCSKLSDDGKWHGPFSAFCLIRFAEIDNSSPQIFAPLGKSVFRFLDLRRINRY